jgi:energy-coupling factor transporter transmembrane protein EcfT
MVIMFLTLIFTFVILIVLLAIIVLLCFTAYYKDKLIKAKKIGIISSSVIGSLLILVICTFGYMMFPSNTPENAIRKYVFFTGEPLKQYDLVIRRAKSADSLFDNGDVYKVSGFNDYLGNPIRYFILHSSRLGWYVSQTGSGI